MTPVVGLRTTPSGQGCTKVAVAGLLVYEHSLVKPNDLSRVDAAFFTMNGIISVVFFAFVLAEAAA